MDYNTKNVMVPINISKKYFARLKIEHSMFFTDFKIGKVTTSIKTPRTHGRIMFGAPYGIEVNN